MRSVLVLGSTGMLGSAVNKALQQSDYRVIEASRNSGLCFDATAMHSFELLKSAGVQAGDYIVNCVGLTKSRIDELKVADRDLAIKLNVVFPMDLANAAEMLGARIIQVATDCVYSGQSGNYLEDSPHDAHDVYGKTKSLGEIQNANVMLLRCSLIGPEVGRSSLLFEWVKNQKFGSTINGFKNHWWNGLSSMAFGRIVSGIIREDLFKAGLQHVVPQGRVTKHGLIRLVLDGVGRNDVNLVPFDAVRNIDRTLATLKESQNREIFTAAGYHQIPEISELVAEMCEELPT